MTLYKRIKDYYDGRKSHYHLEKVALPSDEPQEEDYRGEDNEAIEMFERLSQESIMASDLSSYIPFLDSQGLVRLLEILKEKKK